MDIDQLLRKYSNLDWPYLFEQSHSFEGNNILLFPLALARDWLETPLPELVTAQIKRNKSIQFLLRYMNQVFWKYETHSSDSSFNNLSVWDHKFYLGLRQRLSARIKYLWNVVFTPSGKELSILDLPSYLSFLYWPFRLLRLIKKYGSFAVEKSLKR